MVTALYTHPACLLHDNGFGHPESPDRLRAVLAELDKSAYKSMQRIEAPQATVDQIARVHDRKYVETVLARVPAQGMVQLDPDTFLSSHSGEAALRAAGALIAAVDNVVSGKITNAFCAVRPPGHHAEHATAMGFCLFNNIAVGAAHARAAHNIKRIALFDFDVHHGNGTEEWVKTQDDMIFVSSHQFPFYPGTGAASDRGPKNNIVNVPLPRDSGSLEFREVMQNVALPALEKFQPELIMISAGFDAHKNDPLGGMQLTDEDYGWITTELVKLANKYAKGRIVSTLEGGYDLKALASSTGTHVTALLQA